MPGTTIIMLIAMVAIFYFMLIRPENKRKKEAEELRASLKVGDEITTIGGIVGKVVNVKEDRFVIETGADQVRIEFLKWALSSNDSAVAAAKEQAAKAAAEKLLETIKASAVDGKVSEEKFVEFAAVTQDSKISYTIKKDGQMVEAYENWVFEATEEGQLGLIETEYGWHIMYYGGEDISWRKSANSSAAAEDMDTWFKELPYTVNINYSIFEKIFNK